MSGPDIFVSYAREDEARVAPVVAALGARGWSVFWDRRIPAGKTWRSHIGRALEQARCVIVAWSEHSIQSEWVIEEADEGKRRGVLVPVFLDAVAPPWGFRGIHAADLTGWSPQRPSPAFDSFIDDLGAMLGALHPGPSPPSSAAEISSAKQAFSKGNEPITLPQGAAVDPVSTEATQAADYIYDAFVSYRGAQGARVASWLSHKLGHYRAPKRLLEELPPALGKRLRKRPQVFLETPDKWPSANFWDLHIAPALTHSRRLIVISTADAFEPRSDGSPNNVEREIATYWERFGDPQRILVALAPGAPEDRYPGKLGEISEHWDWVNLRGYRRLYWLFPRRAERLEAAFSKLVAGMYNIPAQYLPVLRREEKLQRNLWLSVLAALLVVAALLGAGISLSFPR